MLTRSASGGAILTSELLLAAAGAVRDGCHVKINVKERPVLFLLFFLCAMGFAAYTHHAWEDYWITFRSSRNLAEGNGLVFQPG